jgi:hypothetical protein
MKVANAKMPTCLAPQAHAICGNMSVGSFALEHDLRPDSETIAGSLTFPREDTGDCAKSRSGFGARSSRQPLHKSV